LSQRVFKTVLLVLTRLRWPIRIFTAIIIGFLLYLNIRLYDQPACISMPGGQINCETLDQLHYLRHILHEQKAAEDMQASYPEGFVFTYALYALAWCEVAAALPYESVSQQEGMQEIARSMEQLQSKRAMDNFNAALPLAYGAFYRGWTSYTEGKFLQLLPAVQRDSEQIARFENDCTAIAQAIEATENPFLESYSGLAWPADNIVCLASLALHDHFLKPRFQNVQSQWLGRIKSTLDTDYQLIPHDFDPSTQHSPEGVRGSSQSLMLCFLPEIDSVFARQQYQIYRQHFLAYRLGLPGIREYASGITGWGDIDSGPVILGIGGAASIVGIRAAACNADWQLYVPLRQTIKGVLLPRNNGKERSYLFGQLPIIDAFMAWSNASTCLIHPKAANNWRWKFQGFSIFILVAAGGVFWKTFRW